MCLTVLPAGLRAQEQQGDQAWAHGSFDEARTAYLRVLSNDPTAVRPNLRLGVMLSWTGQLDSSLIYLARARAADPADPEIRLIQARVLAWDQQYSAALIRYDSLLAQNPSLHDAQLGRAQTLAWSGRLDEALREYDRMWAQNPSDFEALLGSAQVNAWQGRLNQAERKYHLVLKNQSRNTDARVGLGYVYLWQGRDAAARRQAAHVLAIDSTHKGARELRHLARQANRSAVESSAYWSNDSDRNTGFWQTLSGTAGVTDGVAVFGSVNALETSDPVRAASRVGGEAGVTVTAGGLQVTGAAGARQLSPAIAPERTAETYRARLRYRTSGRLGMSVGYARLPFDEIASLFDRQLDMELLEGGIDARPGTNLRISVGGGALWLSDGNQRTSASLGLTQSIRRQFAVGVLGRTLAYERRGIGYFSPDRFSVLEGNVAYGSETRSWIAGLSGGLGAQQVGKRGAAQTAWHLEGRVGPQWGDGNRIELFGLLTNSAVSSTTGAFRYRSAGITVKLGL